MRPKKTINVELLKNKANELLAIEEMPVGEKYGVIAMLETILHKSGNYKGFMFLDNSSTEINTNGHVSRKYF